MSTTVTGNAGVARGKTFLNPKSLVISHVLSVTFTNLTTKVWVQALYTLCSSQIRLSSLLLHAQRESKRTLRFSTKVTTDNPNLYKAPTKVKSDRLEFCAGSFWMFGEFILLLQLL